MHILQYITQEFFLQVVPNTRSRSQMGETTDGGLYEIFQQDYGTVGSPSFEAARENFVISSAGYAVASLLLQPKDRHNGNLLFDKYGLPLHACLMSTKYIDLYASIIEIHQLDNTAVTCYVNKCRPISSNTW